MITGLINNKMVKIYNNNYNINELRDFSSHNQIICPACGSPYEYCHGQIVSPYFRHKTEQSCIGEHYSEPETEEHIKGKVFLSKWIAEQKGVSDVILEDWIPETKQRPDISFIRNGQKCVIEYQCSPISTEYCKRHELYQSIGIQDYWICGTLKYDNLGVIKEDYVWKNQYSEFDFKKGYLVPSEISCPTGVLQMNCIGYYDVEKNRFIVLGHPIFEGLKYQNVFTNQFVYSSPNNTKLGKRYLYNMTAYKKLSYSDEQHDSKYAMKITALYIHLHRPHNYDCSFLNNEKAYIKIKNKYKSYYMSFRFGKISISKKIINSTTYEDEYVTVLSERQRGARVVSQAVDMLKRL